MEAINPNGKSFRVMIGAAALEFSVSGTSVMKVNSSSKSFGFVFVIGYR